MKILNLVSGATETDLIDYIPEGGWHKGLDGLTRICFKDLLSLLSRGAIGPETIYKQRRQTEAKDKLTEVAIGCGSLRKDRNLGPNRCSCQCGAHWNFTACAGKWGGEPVPPAKDRLVESASIVVRHSCAVSPTWVPGKARMLHVAATSRSTCSSLMRTQPRR